jgi:hypothetical protein
MKCTLCSREIKDYSPAFNHLEIDDSHSAELCQNCIDKFVKWYGSMCANLFPTKALKKRYGGNK